MQFHHIVFINSIYIICSFLALSCELSSSLLIFRVRQGRLCKKITEARAVSV